jgi:hypothetical protein
MFSGSSIYLFWTSVKQKSAIVFVTSFLHTNFMDDKLAWRLP